MTIEEVLAELRELAQRRQQGADVSAQTLAAAAQLREHGVTGAHLQRAFPPGTPEYDLLKNTRSPSSYAGPGSDPAVVRELAAQRSLPAGAAIVQPPRSQGGSGGLRGVEVLYAVRDAQRGDMAAYQRLAASSKGMVNGHFLIPQDVIPGYVEARSAAGPIRALCTEHDVQGREVRMILEGEDDLVVESVPEAGTKPVSQAAVEQAISTIHKAAGVTVLPDELLDDARGLAEEIVASKFGVAIGKKVDVDLLDGTGTGQPLGVLRHPDVDHTPVGGQTAMAVYTAIIKALNRVADRFYDNLVVVLHSRTLERFDLATTTTGEFLFAGGLRAKLLDRGVRLVEDANMPVATGNIAPIVVGDFKRLHVFSRQGFTLESSQAPGFVSDETHFRAVERYGALVAKPKAFEVIDGVDLDLAA